MNLFSQYFSLPHRQFFKSPLDMESAYTAHQEIFKKDVAGRWISIYHSDPIAFIASFLTILDQGGFPIALSHPQPIGNRGWSFIEGRWQEDQLQIENESPTQTGVMKYAVPTSGTTGQAKLCEFDFTKAKQNAVAHADGFEISKEYEIIQTLPVSHSYGIIAYILTPLLTGASVNFCSGMVGLRSLKKDSSVRPAVLHVSPSQARFILRDKVTAPRLKKISIGGGAVTLKELKELQVALPETEVYVSYGLTEAGPRVTAGKFHPQQVTEWGLEDHHQWIGSPLKDVKVKLMEERADQSGQLFIETPYAMTNRQVSEQHGSWMRTRDHVIIKNNQVIFLSREDDLIKYGGITIYPHQIEESVRQWPFVTDALVLTESDPIYGDIPVLMIEGQIDQETSQSLAEKTLPYSVAFRKILVVDRFPRKSLEKVDRQSLLQMARNQTV